MDGWRCRPIYSCSLIDRFGLDNLPFKVVCSYFKSRCQHLNTNQAPLQICKCTEFELRCCAKKLCTASVAAAAASNCAHHPLCCYKCLEEKNIIASLHYLLPRHVATTVTSIRMQQGKKTDGLVCIYLNASFIFLMIGIL